MYTIKNFISSFIDYDGSGRVVHGFYRDSFAALYGLDVASVPDECVYINTHSDFLTPLIKAAAKGFEDRIRFFYDVRTTEEYEQTSPDYSILVRAGLKRVSPLCIRGERILALLTAIQTALLDIENEPALFCCSEMFNRYDRNFDHSMKACAFLLYKKV